MKHLMKISKKQQKMLKVQRKQQKLLINWIKFLKVATVAVYDLPANKAKYLKKIKMNDNCINMVNKFGISKSTIVLKIINSKIINKYPRMKNFSLSLLFLGNNFKIIKEICHENASEFE